MSYLLDVNVLIAWGWTDHADHVRTARWIATQKNAPEVTLFTSPIPEIGFVRVSVQRSLGRVTVGTAAGLLGEMLATLGKRHRFLPDDLSGTVWPSSCNGAAQTTDAHLAELARSHELLLATLDQSIPKSFLLPPVS